MQSIPFELQEREIALAKAWQNDWKSQPTEEQVTASYQTPQAPGHWRNILGLVRENGYGVEPNPYRYGTSLSEADPTLPDFKISWPSEAMRNKDYEIFFDAAEMIINTLDVDDAVFAQTVQGTIFSVLGKSHLFSELFRKQSVSQKASVRKHVETVPTLLQTSGLKNEEKFILRMIAVFHDLGKAFNIGRDQVHYHALIASNVVAWFMDAYKDKLITALEKHDRKSQDKVFSNQISFSASAQNERAIEFIAIKNQITEGIRLHHVLEQIEKGKLDLKVVAEIFKAKEINPLLFGLFFLADASSVIPDNPIYATFLLQNVHAYISLLEVLTETEETTEVPFLSIHAFIETVNSVIHNLQTVLRLIISQNIEESLRIVEKTTQKVSESALDIHPLITSAWNELVPQLIALQKLSIS